MNATTYLGLELRISLSSRVKQTFVSKTSIELTWYVNDSEMVLLRTGNLDSKNVLAEGGRSVILAGPYPKAHCHCSLWYY